MAINVKNKFVTLESLGVAYSAEQDAREEADQALSTRIDNIVAPDGDPSLTEVSDARVSGSTTYNTLKARLDADKAAIGTEISQLSADLESIEESGVGLSESVKSALIACFRNVAWANTDGQTYYDTMHDVLYPPSNLVSISAVYTQSGTVYDIDSLDTLRDGLVVTATYENSTTQTITSYTLSGTLSEGTSTITVTYGEQTATFTVTVTSRTVELPWVSCGSTNKTITNNGDGTYSLNGYIVYASTSAASASMQRFQVWAGDVSEGDTVYLNFNNPDMVSFSFSVYIIDSDNVILQKNAYMAGTHSGDITNYIPWAECSNTSSNGVTVGGNSYFVVPTTGKIVLACDTYVPDSETSFTRTILRDAVDNGVFDFRIERATT